MRASPPQNIRDWFIGLLVLAGFFGLITWLASLEPEGHRLTRADLLKMIAAGLGYSLFLLPLLIKRFASRPRRTTPPPEG